MNKPDNKLAIEMVALMRIHQAQIYAYGAAVHSMLRHHPQLDMVANDFMIRMDNYADTMSPDRLAEAREPWQLILQAMTEELARRKDLSTD